MADLILWNFINDRVIVNPLRIRIEIIYELENNSTAFFIATYRESAMIIKEQVKNVISNNIDSITAMHSLKSKQI